MVQSDTSSGEDDFRRHLPRFQAEMVRLIAGSLTWFSPWQSGKAARRDRLRSHGFWRRMTADELAELDRDLERLDASAPDKVMANLDVLGPKVGELVLGFAFNGIVS